MNERPHKKPEVWKESIQPAKKIYQFSESLPTEERYGLCSQICRASVSANIAEGAARKSSEDFLNYLNIAASSLRELDTHFEILSQIGYINSNAKNDFDKRIDKISALLAGLYKSVKTRT